MQKRLAVRRLSQGSKRNLPSPQGEGKFSFKSNSQKNPEELKLKRKKLQQKLETWNGKDKFRILFKIPKDDGKTFLTEMHFYLHQQGQII